MNYELIKPGLYKITWKSGNVSHASIGIGVQGSNWIACTDWPEPKTAYIDYYKNQIEQIVEISPEDGVVTSGGSIVEKQKPDISTLHEEILEIKQNLLNITNMLSKNNKD